MSMPLSTVRLQLHRDFTLADAAAQVPYFSGLGISHLYLSPITQARSGSTHGYDVVDPTVISTELGGMEALQALVDVLRGHGMGLLLDIVPNHMATHSSNAWWWDVLCHGPLSRYASWFDIDWQAPESRLRGKVLAPFLAQPYGASLADGSIKVVFDPAQDTHRIEACGARYPIAPDSMRVAGLDAQMAARYYDGRHEDGRQRLHELLERQHYRLAWWRCAADIINWRRFFEVSELIGVCVERPEVFDAVHALPLRLYAEGLVDGLRIDHVDGLAQPIAYCAKLRAALAERRHQRPKALQREKPWLLVEKILAPGETLEPRWQVDGTSGYDFMDQAGAVLHDPDGRSKLTAFWKQTAQDGRDGAQYLREARRLMLDRHFAAERKALLRVLTALAHDSVYGRDWSRELIGRVLDRFLIAFPVYRSYIDAEGRSPRDADLFAQVIDEVCLGLDRDDADSSKALLAWLDTNLAQLGKAGNSLPAVSTGDIKSVAIRRFQQLTPPLAAKSLEDTTFYRYGRLLSRNEVGSDPGIFCIHLDQYHERNRWRATHAARSMLATATHDHKRGEDTRARLAVLSEAASLWTQACARWMQWPGTPGLLSAVHAAERYMLFQTIVGAWPLAMPAQDAEAVHAFLERLMQWQTKALREAKQSSSWFHPDEDHEAQARAFLQAMAVGAPQHGLLVDIGDFVRHIAAAGALNSLVQIVLRTTAPGIPDLYQGTEYWDFSLVDPDNRCVVDFSTRKKALAAFDEKPDTEELVQHWRDGRIKQAILALCLRLRQQWPAIFSQGSYRALPVTGPGRANVLAYVRGGDGQDVMIVLPRLCWRGLAQQEADCRGPMRQPGALGIPPGFWSDTRVTLAREYAGMPLTNVLNGTIHRPDGDAALRLADLFSGLPLAVLIAA